IKNRDFIEFCGSKGIKREYSNVRTPQQNRVAKRKNMTLIEQLHFVAGDSEKEDESAPFLMQGILKKKMNLLKTTLYCQYGLLIPQQSRDQE
ncbi:putative ribonuclease H-like domain-containing protein, partial [Tanacetum coccineum]